jgi:hypothetical protein
MKKRNLMGVLLLVLLLAVSAWVVLADPSGTTISSNSTDTGRTSTPSNRTDPGGSITTLNLDAVQQDSQWKAYVGNITGSLRLEDTAGSSIYNWALSSMIGEIYVSRSSSITWSTVNCTTATNITAEETALSINSSGVDSIKNTFNTTTHPAFSVAGRSITANSCNATSTLVSGARQPQATADFPELILHDTTNFIYTTIITNDKVGYNGSDTYDFQMIVADNPSTTSNTYYFFAELGS